MAKRKRQKSIALLAGGAIAALILHWLNLGPSAVPVRGPIAERPVKQQPEKASPIGQFDFYTLALSLAPAFCEREPQKRQCQKLTAQLDQATPLTLHGLWPEFRGAGRYPQNCAGQTITVAELERNLDAQRLRRLMPGVTDGLASHEWRKHGVCTGLSPQRYFALALDQAERINAALSSILRAASGKEMSRAGLRQSAEHMMPGLGQALTLHCQNLKTQDPAQRNRPVLIELRVCLRKAPDNGLDGLTECAGFDRIDQGCPERLYIDAV
jgi:ribonuclease T2